jgi:TDG/mug DNA glycosylase family protein
MDRETIAAYDAGARTWRDRRASRFLDRAAAFGALLAPGATVADLGCGAGGHLTTLPRGTIGLDASAAMLDLARVTAPDVALVRGDLEHLPFRRGALRGAWARATYLHIPRDRLPRAMAELQRAVAPDGPVHLTMLRGYADGPFPDDPLPGRHFSNWEPDALDDLLVGAGFTIESTEPDAGEGEWLHVAARRARTLPDVVGPRMRLLLCGLNPSVYSADVGVGFARPGNRFWPAALAAGLVTRDHDAFQVLDHDGIGMTDLVKRATARADELSRDEYVVGAARVERLVRWLRPGAVCFVGLSGYRAAVDRGAAAGVQSEPFGGVPAYVMPNPSGLNAHATPAILADHLRAAATLADESRASRDEGPTGGVSCRPPRRGASRWW